LREQRHVLHVDGAEGVMDGDLLAGWGVRPVLVVVAGVPIPSYELFVALGLAAGFLVFRGLARRDRAVGDKTVLIGAAALVGAAAGAKLLEWAFTFPAVLHARTLSAVFAGKTVIGGFVGGSLGVLLVKRSMRIRERRGNLFAPAIALGLAIGRIGCFLRGCCYGEPTSLPWGIDFGDHVARHPTQIYEALFSLALFVVLMGLRHRVTTPGRLLSVFMLTYLAFRFVEEFVRSGDRLALGLTFYQFAAVAAFGYFVFRDYRLRREAAVARSA
jgi:phosphatidylglycerol---prolipoprotein diacylglyceryl transferase